MKLLLTILFCLVVFSSCDNRSEEKREQARDSLDIIPGFGGGHEPGKGEEGGPSYPQPTYAPETETDTSRGIHGVNVDTTGTDQR